MTHIIYLSIGKLEHAPLAGYQWVVCMRNINVVQFETMPKK